MSACWSRPGLLGSDGQKRRETLSSHLGFLEFFWKAVALWLGSGDVSSALFWIGRARHPGPDRVVPFKVEVFNVGGWLAHGEYACGAAVKFIGDGEHGMIPG